MLRLILAVAVVLGVALVFQVASGDTRSAYGYIERGGNRKEGLKTVPSSSLSLRVVSFLAHREDKDFEKGDDIKLRFYVPSGEPVFLTASEIVPVHNYFMKPLKSDWPTGWQLFSDWPADEVLRPRGIRPADLGIVGRVNQEKPGSGTLVPLLFYVDDPPDKISSYEVRLVSREVLTVLRYDLRREGASEPILKKVLRKEFSAGAPILIRLNLVDQPPGSFTLRLFSKIKGLNHGPKRTYVFYHVPDVSGP